MDTTVFPPRFTRLGTHLGNGVYDDGAGQWVIPNGNLPPVRIAPGDRSDLTAAEVGDSAAVLPQRDGTVRVVELTTGRSFVVPVGGAVRQVEFTGDDRWAFVTTAATVIAVNVTTGEHYDLSKRPAVYRNLHVTRTYAMLDDWVAVWKEPALSGPPPALRHVADPLDLVCQLIQRPLSAQEWSSYAPGQPHVNPC